MKNRFIVILLLLVSCSRSELESFKLRSDCYLREKHSRSDTSKVDSPVNIPHDTTLYYSLVKYASDYDWKKDKSAGKNEFMLEYYKDNSLIFSQKGPLPYLSSDPDTHHIINGSLFTQNSLSSTTHISRDGQEIMSFEGREFIKGIIIEHADVYTLGVSRNGNGFSYRCNGEVIFSSNIGYILGDLSDPSYPDTGALYDDDGNKCFCYFLISNGTKSYYSVINGVEQELKSINSAVDDIKIHKGKVISSKTSYNLEDARITLNYVSGYITNQYSAVVSVDSGKIFRLCDQKSEILVGKNKAYAVSCIDGDTIVLYSKDITSPEDKEAETICSYTDVFLLSNSIINICEDTPLIALSSKINAFSSIILTDKDEIKLSFNGYVSKVYMSINPPN